MSQKLYIETVQKTDDELDSEMSLTEIPPHKMN